MRTIILFFMVCFASVSYGQNSFDRFKKVYNNGDSMSTFLNIPYVDARFTTFVNGLMNQPAYNFSFLDLKGDTVALSDFKGKVVFLNVFFRGCGPCINELPSLNALAKEYTAKEAVFIAVSLTDTKKSVERFVSRYNADTTNIMFIPASIGGELDEGYDTKKITAAYKNITRKVLQEQYLVPVAPANIIIDKDGIVRLAILGYAKPYAHIYDNLFKDALNELVRP